MNLDSFENDPGNGFFYVRASGSSLILSFTNPPPGGLVLAIALTPTTLELSSSGGPAGNAGWILSSTNLALPLSQWQHLATNAFDNNGNILFSFPRISGAVNAFYRLQSQ